MAFKGVSKDGDRANVLAYLRTLSADAGGPAGRIGGAPRPLPRGLAFNAV